MNFTQLKAMLDEATVTELSDKYGKVVTDIKGGITTQLEDIQLGEVKFFDPQAMKSKSDIHCMWGLDLSTTERERFMRIDVDQFQSSEIVEAVIEGIGKHIEEDDGEAFNHDANEFTKENSFKFTKLINVKDFETNDGDKVSLRIEVAMVKRDGTVHHENYPAFEIKILSELAES